LFGGAELFAQKTRLVAYFPDSVKGLRTGANVLFRGVRIGFVEDIQLQGDVNTLETQVQVTMRIFPEQYKLTSGGRVVADASGEEVESMQLVETGLKAQLGVESFVTGQLLIEFDFYPGEEIVYRGSGLTPYNEVPTIPNDIQQLVANVQRFMADLQQSVDVKQITENVQNALRGIDELANSQDLREALAGLNRAVSSEATQQLSARLGVTLEDASDALGAVEKLAINVDSDIGPLTEQLRAAASKLTQTLTTAETTLKDMDAQLRGDTELSYQLVGTLEEVQTAARSLRMFLDYLERHPEALLQGKSRP
jgi:paraquat-inducible protein B